MARVFSKVELLDYSETLVPVVKFTSIRVLFSLVSINELHLHQMDVMSEFLTLNIKEDVFTEQKDGIRG